MKITFLGTGAADFMPSLADTDRFTVSRDIRRCTEKISACGPVPCFMRRHTLRKSRRMGGHTVFYLKVIAHSLTMLYNQNKSAHILLENRGI